MSVGRRSWNHSGYRQVEGKQLNMGSGRGHQEVRGGW